MTPLISADTGDGAAGCASGSQTCSGRRPALAPKPASARKKAAVGHAPASATERIESNV